MLDIKIDADDIARWKRALEGIRSNMASGIIPRTLNWVGNKARTQTFRALAAQTGLHYGDVRDAVDTHHASRSYQVYELDAKGGYLTMARFHPVQRKEGVEARPWGIRRLFPGAFIVRKLPPLAFVRSSRARFPIRPLYGPAIPNEMLKDAAVKAFTETCAREMGPRLEHEVDRSIANEGLKTLTT